MKKNYIYIIIVFLLLSVPFHGLAQSGLSNATNNSDTIEGFSIFPNPVSNGKLYIITKDDLAKDIKIYDVLGKKVYDVTVFGKELDVSKLTPGVYIFKIKENNKSATRKLVVR